MAKRKSSKVLKSVPEVVKALGGPDAISELTGVGRSTVSNWATWGFIPPGWYMAFKTRLEAKGFILDPDVFGFKTVPHFEGEARHVA